MSDTFQSMFSDSEIANKTVCNGSTKSFVHYLGWNWVSSWKMISEAVCQKQKVRLL